MYVKDLHGCRETGTIVTLHVSAACVKGNGLGAKNDGQIMTDLPVGLLRASE